MSERQLTLLLQPTQNNRAAEEPVRLKGVSYVNEYERKIKGSFKK